MKPQTASKSFNVALSSFVVAGLLAVLLLATLSTSWGVAYGQTAGPTTTPACTTAGNGSGGAGGTPCATTPPEETVPIGSNGCTGNGTNPGGNGSTTPGANNGNGNTGGNGSSPSCQPTAVEGTGTSPTKNPSAVDDANQSPGGVVPGLPHTGTGSAVQSDADTLKLWALGVLALTMLVSALAMLVLRKSAGRR